MICESVTKNITFIPCNEEINSERNWVAGGERSLFSSIKERQRYICYESRYPASFLFLLLHFILKFCF